MNALHQIIQLACKNQGCGGRIWQQGPHSHVDEGVQAFKSKTLKCTSIRAKFASWTTLNVNNGVCCLSFKNYVPGESKASPNVDINVLFKIVVLEIKHIFIFFLLKNLQHFLHQKLKNFKVSTRSNKYELIYECILLFVAFQSTFFHMV